MKTFKLLTCVMLCFGYVNAQDGNIPNGSFENWSSQKVYDKPDVWTSSNSEEYRGVDVVLKSSDAAVGNSSIEIRAALVGDDTVFGYFLHGDVPNDGPPESGISYTADFDEVRFKFKANVSGPNDYIYLVIGRFTGGVSTYLETVLAIDRSSNDWIDTAVSIPAGTQDELFFGIVVGDPFQEDFKPTPGTWARIDDIRLYNGSTAATALPNNGFEDWTAVSVEDPDSWHTANFMAVGINKVYARKTTDKKSGTYAIELETIALDGDGEHMIHGYLSLGAIKLGEDNQSEPFYPVPYHHQPQTISGSFKFSSPATHDSAGIHVIFKKNGAQIASHYQLILLEDEYTDFSASINLANEPDSVIIVVRSGQTEGAVLILDDLTFSGGNVSVKTPQALATLIYPNPVKTSLKIDVHQACEYRIIDMSGKIFLSGKGVEGTNNLDISKLSNGMYFVVLQSGNHAESHSFIKE